MPQESADAFERVVERVPESTRAYVLQLLGSRAVTVRVVVPRHTKLGDYRPPRRAGQPHRITVNDDLNPFAFLTTLLHEIAHLVTNEAYRRRVRPHGREWKRQFRLLLAPVVSHGGLPDDVVEALARSMQNLRAATCSDRNLQAVLRRYDSGPEARITLDSLPEGAFFRLATGRVFRKGLRLRSRYRCTELGSGLEYRVRADCRADPVAEPPSAHERSLHEPHKPHENVHAVVDAIVAGPKPRRNDPACFPVPGDPAGGDRRADRGGRGRRPARAG